LPDGADTAARLAAGKHLMEEYLQYPLIVKPPRSGQTRYAARAAVPEFSVASD